MFDEEKARLLGKADKVVVVTRQTKDSVFATETLVSNINGVSSEKYFFICNDFRKDEENFLTSPETPVRFHVNEYIDHFSRGGNFTLEELAHNMGIQKTAFLVM